ncbi:MAG: MgtC/SapB family protein [Oscillospiraceae bacterium]|nr:MgtC/SapB family protein [Oscillospiraceae bacterium]
MAIREITYLAVALRVFAAALLGGLMGWERGLKNRAAGLRTYMLVCVGSCLIMLTNQFIYQSFGTGDPVRMGAQVVSGIGFLGAGTIIVTRRHQIKGLTTAAGLWADAGVGLALGIGFYEGAVVGAITVLIVMTLMQHMDSKMHRKSRSLDIYFEMSSNVPLGDLLRYVHNNSFEIADIQKEPYMDLDDGVRAYTATIKVKKRRLQEDLLEEFMQAEGVIYAEAL